jgi:hypothetical protein
VDDIPVAEAAGDDPPAPQDESGDAGPADDSNEGGRNDA